MALKRYGPSRPTLRLIGENANAFMILGLAKRAALKGGWTKEQWTAFREDAMSGDYDHLLGLTNENFEVE